MNYKTISILMIAIIAICFVPGCLGDKIVGTWEAQNSIAGNITATFNDDNTAKIVTKGVITSFVFDDLVWEKDGIKYIIRNEDGDKFGTAEFDGDNLKIVAETGVAGINFSETYTKVEK